MKNSLKYSKYITWLDYKQKSKLSMMNHRLCTSVQLWAFLTH